MLVTDAGAVAQVLLGMPSADRIWAALQSSQGALHAPGLLDVEVLSVLRKLTLRGELTEGRAAEAVADLQDLRIVRHPLTALLDRAWALRGAFTPYDAVYVALTESFGEQAALLTTDHRLARAVGQQSPARVVDLSPG